MRLTQHAGKIHSTGTGTMKLSIQNLSKAPQTQPAIQPVGTTAPTTTSNINIVSPTPSIVPVTPEVRTPEPISQSVSLITLYPFANHDAPRFPVTAEQLKDLYKLKYQNGEHMFPEGVKNNDILYETMHRITQVGYDEVYNFLNLKIWKDEVELYFNFKEFEAAEFKFNKFIEQQFIIRKVESGIFVCGTCKNKNTISFSVQLRARDEGETTFVRCLPCEKQWSIG